MELMRQPMSLPAGAKPFSGVANNRNACLPHRTSKLHQCMAPRTTCQANHQRVAEAAPTQQRVLQPGQQQEASTGLQQVGQAVAATALALAVSIGGLLPVQPASAVTSEQLLFLEAWRAVDRAYVDKTFNGQSWFKLREDYLKKQPMATREQTYAAIQRLVGSLDDPFTRFLPPERLAALRRGTQGSVTGVGVEITYSSSTNNDLVVLTPAPGGPAEAAGIKAGDVIESIDGVPAKGLSLYEAGDLLQGEGGTQVELVVHSGNGGGNRRTVALTRQKVVVNPVTSQLCSGVTLAALPAGAAAGKVGIIRVATFNSNTAEAVEQAMLDLQKQGVAGFILDIRNNGGGLFPAGVGVARLWVDKGDIVLIADSQGVRDIYSADGNALDANTPLVTLVNKGTASASEVLAGALKDSKRAKIVGENTFGKGLIQTVVELSDGSGVAVTVAKYQTPAGVDINKVGIAPDVRVAPDELPTDGAGLCGLLSSEAAPRLFV